MGAAYTSNYLLLAIIVVATASVAQASLVISGVNVSGVLVTGVYVKPASAPISVAGVNITLSCDGGATTIGTQATLTGPVGAFQVATTTGNGTLFQQSKCAVYAYINASAIASAPLIPLGILPGLNLTVANGQITITVKIGSSIAAYLAGLFVPVA